jgi:hypothetical protein
LCDSDQVHRQTWRRRHESTQRTGGKEDNEVRRAKLAHSPSWHGPCTLAVGGRRAVGHPFDFPRPLAPLLPHMRARPQPPPHHQEGRSLPTTTAPRVCHSLPTPLLLSITRRSATSATTHDNDNIDFAAPPRHSPQPHGAATRNHFHPQPPLDATHPFICLLLVTRELLQPSKSR